jgi:hypothetical protein
MIRASLILFIIISSCNAPTRDKNEAELKKVEKQYDYRITVDTWNGFFGHASKFILDNSQVGFYDSTQLDGFLKPFTFYYIAFESRESKQGRVLTPIDTTEIPFSKALSDTLFLLTKSFFKSLDFNNSDTVGKLTPIITDDSKGCVELHYRGRTLSATISSISNPTIATKELDTLRRFVNKFKPAN